MKTVHTIHPDDIGKRFIKIAAGDTISVTNLMGHIASYDVGKKIVKTGEIFQVENTEQLNERIKNEISAAI